MGYTPDKFKDNDMATSGQSYTLSIALDKDNPEDFEEICTTTLEENFNEKMESWATTCSNGDMISAPSGQDYEIPWNVMMIKGDLSNRLYKLKHDQQARMGIPVKLDNALMNVSTTFSGAISFDKAGGDAEKFAQFSGTIKVFNGIIETDVITPEEVITITATDGTLPVQTENTAPTDQQLITACNASVSNGETPNVSTIEIIDWTIPGTYPITFSSTGASPKTVNLELTSL